MLQCFNCIGGLQRVGSQLNTQSHTEQSGRLRTTKTNKNIARVAAVYKNDYCASCRMIVESTEYQKPSFTAFYLSIWKNKNCGHDLWRMRQQQNNENSALFTQKTTIPVLSWFESAQLFYISEVINRFERGPICNYKRIQTSVMTKLKTIPITDFSRVMH